MTWQQRAMGVVTLVALMMVPASAAICAVACHEDRAAAGHCHEPADSPGATQLRDGAEHECGGHEALVGDVAPPTLRVVALASPLPFAHPLLQADWPRTHVTVPSSAPPGSDPPTTIPTVLRV